MLTSRLVHLIESHAKSLTTGVMQDIMSNKHTTSFRAVPIADLELRIATLYQNLGKWLGNPKEDGIQKEYEEWGSRPFHRGIPLSEIVYSLILIKAHLRRFIREHGLVGTSADQVTPDELVPVELYAIQELNYMVGEFFDRALYHLTRGYEAAAKTSRAAA